MARYEVDEVDERMVAILREDSRTSFADIAPRVGLSPDAVRARYTRLVSDGIVRVLGLVHPSSLGFAEMATVWLSFDGSPENLAEQLSASPNITFMTELLGSHNLQLEVCGADYAEIADIIDTVLRPMPEVGSISLAGTLEVVKWRSQAHRGSLTATVPGVGLGELDLRLLRLLVDNPRLSYRELSDQLDESYWNVRKRTQALFAENVIRATAMVDRVSTESRVMASIELKLSGPETTAALREIAAVEEVAILIVTSGKANATAEVSCTDRQELAALGRTIVALPGVASVVIRPYVRTLVMPMPWSMDPDPAWR